MYQRIWTLTLCDKVLKLSSLIGPETYSPKAILRLLSLSGGHSTFADVTANGSDTGGLGIYTLTGSEPDSWLAQVFQQGGAGSSNKVLHGVFTYDWQAIFDTLLDMNGNLRRPQQWERIDYPLALIAYGETTAPF